MVEIAKAIAKNAKIIIFDEPTTSLSNTEKDVLFSIMKDLSSQGISMIFISHALDDVLNQCDEILVLRDGQVIGKQEKTGDVTKESIIKNMVGREMTKLYPYIEKKPGKELFAVKNVSKAGVVENISFNLLAGKIIGMFGLMGAGRSEFANIVFGVDQPDSGEITLNGTLMKHWTPNAWIDSGVAYITENRRDDGLLLPKTVKDNLILVNMYRMKSGFGVLNQKAASEISRQMVDKLQIKTFDSAKQTVRSLSGGNQQKVVIGKWLMIAPKVFILDEPTRGVDVGAKYEIYNHINSLAEDGSAVLFISSEMDELMGVCDSILVMSSGRITGEVQRNDFSQERLMKLALGE
jgi:ribose transport system ATP-binding protein